MSQDATNPPIPNTLRDMKPLPPWSYFGQPSPAGTSPKTSPQQAHIKTGSAGPTYAQTFYCRSRYSHHSNMIYHSFESGEQDKSIGVSKSCGNLIAFILFRLKHKKTDVARAVNYSPTAGPGAASPRACIDSSAGVCRGNPGGKGVNPCITTTWVA